MAACHDGAVGQRRRSSEKIDVNTFKKEEKFAEFWDEGKVKPLKEFLAEKNIDLNQYNTEAKQQRFVEEDSWCRLRWANFVVSMIHYKMFFSVMITRSIFCFFLPLLAMPLTEFDQTIQYSKFLTTVITHHSSLSRTRSFIRSATRSNLSRHCRRRNWV